MYVTNVTEHLETEVVLFDILEFILEKKFISAKCVTKH